MLSIKKEVMEPQRHVSHCWDSIHVIEVVPKDGNKQATYKLTTTVMLTMTTSKGNAGNVNLSGSPPARDASRLIDGGDDANHVINMGKLIEAMELDLRNQLDQLYIQKTRGLCQAFASLQGRRSNQGVYR